MFDIKTAAAGFGRPDGIPALAQMMKKFTRDGRSSLEEQDAKDRTQFVNLLMERIDDKSYPEFTALITVFLFPDEIDEKEATRRILAGKICDVLEIAGLKSKKTFSKLIETYKKILDDAVSAGIQGAGPAAKGKTAPPETRAKKYYTAAKSIGETNKLRHTGLSDYSRLMLCLYTAILRNGGKPVADFDYSADCLDLVELVTGFRKSMRISDPGDNQFFFIILILMFYSMKHGEED